MRVPRAVVRGAFGTDRDEHECEYEHEHEGTEAARGY